MARWLHSPSPQSRGCGFQIASQQTIMSDQDGDSTAARAAPPLSRAISDRFQDFGTLAGVRKGPTGGSSNLSHDAVSIRGARRHPRRTQEALARLGRVLVEFDDDQRIQVSGFGDANTLENAVFSFTPDAPFKGCKGFHEIWRRYHEVTPTVLLGQKPANLAPVIRHAIATTREATGLHILLILASSQLADQHQEDTVQAIVDASMLPICTWQLFSFDLSGYGTEPSNVCDAIAIIVIGMGDGPWVRCPSESSLKRILATLDDRLPHRQFDNFQFVNFHKVMHSSTAETQKVRAGSETALASALDPMDLVFTLQILMELPAQFDAMCELHLL
ncbi:hypothetical protein BBJ28_00010542 [Nothophytophthora sp. Chile5]|nr:hypothetical protein BBJ28_00010542 [Nothophytophthora sp. Chile5]